MTHSNTQLVATLGMSGYGVADPLNDGDFISDGYDTAEDAICAARETLALVNRGVDIDLARQVAHQILYNDNV